MPRLDRDLPTLPEHLSLPSVFVGISVAQSLKCIVVDCVLFFVVGLFLFRYGVVSVFMTYACPFCILHLSFRTMTCLKMVLRYVSVVCQVNIVYEIPFKYGMS